MWSTNSINSFIFRVLSLQIIMACRFKHQQLGCCLRFWHPLNLENQQGQEWRHHIIMEGPSMYFNSMETQPFYVWNLPQAGVNGVTIKEVFINPCWNMLEPLLSHCRLFLTQFRQLPLGGGGSFLGAINHSPGEVVVYFHDTPWLGMMTLDPHATNPSTEPLGFDEPRRPETQDTRKMKVQIPRHRLLWGPIGSNK